MIFGIVGYGRFGKLWANALSDLGEVIVYDCAEPLSIPDHSRIKIGSLQEVAQADLIFILTPISHFEAACRAIKPYVKSDATILDCCSVKMYPASVLQKIFNNNETLIATHPLFGPDSIMKTGSFLQHKIVVCQVRSTENKLDFVIGPFQQMGLNVLLTTPEDHDQQMANSQGLVHFIGRGLSALEIKEQGLATPDFQALLNINHMVVNDSWQLFLDMHQYNSYTKAMRVKLIQSLIAINKEIDDETKS